MNLKKLKLLYETYNFFHKSDLKHNIPLYKKYNIDKRYYESISSEDFKNIPSERNKYDRLDSAEHIEKEAVYQKLNPEYQNAVQDWSSKGYVILRDFYSGEIVNSVNEEIQRLIKEDKVQYRNQKNKIMFAFHHSPLIKDIGTNEQLTDILEMLMGKEVELFQSINFKKGSQQRSHSDTIHMTTFPLGNLIAVWIALEDITEENGPLHYYPGSHKLPYIMNRDYGNTGSRFFLGNKTYSDYEDKVQEIIEEEGLEKKIFLANKGDLLIWHANLLHGGELMKDQDLSRKSMVFHYYSKDAICYHEITQRPSLKPS